MVHRKGGKTVTIPLAPRTARAVELAIGERLEGPIFLDIHGQRLRREESVLVEVARRPEQQRGWCAAGQAGRHRQAHRPPQAQASFITAALDAGLPLRDVQEAAATPRLASGWHSYTCQSRFKHTLDESCGPCAAKRAARYPCCVSQVERVTAREKVGELSDADRGWLHERLAEYAELLEYLHDH